MRRAISPDKRAPIERLKLLTVVLERRRRWRSRSPAAHVRNHLLGQQPFVERRIARHRCRTAAVVLPSPAIGQQRREVQPALPRRLALGAGCSSCVWPISSAMRAHAQLRHDLATFLGHEAEIVDHHFRQADEVLLRAARLCCVATPVAQLLRWQMRRYLQPSATIGAVPKPKLSAPRMAALITSRPVLRPPSVCSAHACGACRCGAGSGASRPGPAPTACRRT